MSTLDIHALLAMAQGALDKAVETLARNQHTEVRTKGDRDLVTDVELSIERLVRADLQECAPDIGFLGEESGAADVRHVYWVLDPVDGTANFVHGVPLYAVALGLVEGDQPVLGLVDMPFIGLRYWAARDCGAFRNGEPISVSNVSNVADAMIALSDYGTGEGGSVRTRTSFSLDRALTKQAQRVRRLGSSAVELAWVADGRLDASVTLGNRSWDTAAGALIAREAGAVVMDADGSPHSINSRSIIATTPDLLDTLLPLLRIVRGTRYWPTTNSAERDCRPGDRRMSSGDLVGTAVFCATIGVGIGDDDTVDTIVDGRFDTADEARVWIEQTLPKTQFPDWVMHRPFGSAGAYLFGSVQAGAYVSGPDGADTVWAASENAGVDADAVLVDGHVRWLRDPDAAV